MASIISKNIRYLRKQKHMGQEQLGKLLGKSESAIQMWESDKRSPTMGTVQKLSEIFNVDMNTLVYDDLENKKADNIGIKIKELRESNGMSIDFLAYKFKVKRSTILHWENGISSPSIDDLHELANLFHVSYGFIKGYETIDDIEYKSKIASINFLNYFEYGLYHFGFKGMKIIDDFICHWYGKYKFCDEYPNNLSLDEIKSEIYSWIHAEYYPIEDHIEHVLHYLEQYPMVFDSDIQYNWEEKTVCEEQLDQDVIDHLIYDDKDDIDNDNRYEILCLYEREIALEKFTLEFTCDYNLTLKEENDEIDRYIIQQQLDKKRKYEDKLNLYKSHLDKIHILKNKFGAGFYDSYIKSLDSFSKEVKQMRYDLPVETGITFDNQEDAVLYILKCPQIYKYCNYNPDQYSSEELNEKVKRILLAIEIVMKKEL